MYDTYQLEAFGVKSIKFDADRFDVEVNIDYKLVLEPYEAEEHLGEFLSFDE